MSRNLNPARSHSLSMAVAALLLAIPEIGVSQVRGPTSGVVFHRASRTLRPILGVPGSAYLGAPVFQDVDAAFVSPDGNCAFVVRNSDHALVCGLLDGPVADTPIPGLSGDSAVWNRKGDTAAFYSSAQMSLQVIHLRGRGEPAVVGASLDLSALGGTPSTVAVSDDGRQVAVGVEGGLYQISDDGSLTLAAPIGKPVSAVFGSSGNTLYVLDQSTREIRVLGTSAISSIPLADSDASDPQAVGLAVSDDGGKVWVALANKPAVRTYEAATGRLYSEDALDLAPSFLQRITSSSLYLLNAAESKVDPFLVLRTGDQPGVFFIPACGDCL